MSAPRMTVRTHVPLGVKVVVGCVAFAIAVGTGVLLSRTAVVHRLLGDPDPQVGRLIDENQALRAERERSVESSNTTDSRRAIEGATIKELGEQIARLESQNVRLKEDVAFFEAATDRSATKDSAAAGIAIRRFQVVEDKAKHAARFRILLTQDSKANRDFSGELRLTLTVVRAGKAVSIDLPEISGSPAVAADRAPYVVAFRSYKRIDGSFDVPADSTLRSVQARILERGAVRAQQTFTVG